MNSNNGKIQWTPGEHQVGVYKIRIMVSDLKGGVDYQNFTIKVVNSFIPLNYVTLLLSDDHFQGTEATAIIKVRDNLAAEDDNKIETIEIYISSNSEKDGIILFSNNYRKFKMDLAGLNEFQLEDLSKSTLPPDFERKPKSHNCWKITNYRPR